MRSLIIVVSILVLAVTTATIVIGKRSFDGVVVERPYETGLDWDRKQEQKARLGWKVSVKTRSFLPGRNDLSLSVLDGNNKPINDAAVSVKVSRPSTTAYDKTYQTGLQPDGTYLSSIDLALYGNWAILINVRRGKDQAEFIKSIFADQGN